MWLWILSVFAVAAIWIIGGYLALALWLRIALTAVVVAIVASVLVFRRLRATRAAKALENELLRQAEQQARDARELANERVAGGKSRVLLGHPVNGVVKKGNCRV